MKCNTDAVENYVVLCVCVCVCVYVCVVYLLLHALYACLCVAWSKAGGMYNADMSMQHAVGGDQ